MEVLDYRKNVPIQREAQEPGMMLDNPDSTSRIHNEVQRDRLESGEEVRVYGSKIQNESFTIHREMVMSCTS